MQVQLVEREPIVLAGMSYHGPLTSEGWSRQNPIGQLWNRFNDFFDKMPSFSQDHALNPAVGYEISIWSEREFQESKCFYVFVGIEVDQLDDMPLELVGKVLPSSTYAHLIPKGQEITSWETTFYEEWLPGSGNKLAAHGGYNFQIQAYEEGRFKGLGELIEGSEIDVYVPVEKA